MIGRRSGPDYGPRKEHGLFEDQLADFETIRDDFASLDDWEDRYRYVIELGHTLEPLSEAAHNEINKVRGCVSQVWLEREDRTRVGGQTILHYRGDSDSHIVRGLIALAVALSPIEHRNRFSPSTPWGPFARWASSSISRRSTRTACAP